MEKEKVFKTWLKFSSPMLSYLFFFFPFSPSLNSNSSSIGGNLLVKYDKWYKLESFGRKMLYFGHMTFFLYAKSRIMDVPQKRVQLFRRGNRWSFGPKIHFGPWLKIQAQLQQWAWMGCKNSNSDVLCYKKSINEAGFLYHLGIRIPYLQNAMIIIESTISIGSKEFGTIQELNEKVYGRK